MEVSLLRNACAAGTMMRSPPQAPPHFAFFLRIFLRIPPPFKNNPVKNFRIPPPLQKRKIGFGGGVFTVNTPDNYFSKSKISACFTVNTPPLQNRFFVFGGGGIPKFFTGLFLKGGYSHENSQKKRKMRRRLRRASHHCACSASISQKGDFHTLCYVMTVLL